MQGLYNGKSLSPNEGVLAPLMKHLLESMLNGELESHLQEDKASGNSNRRNGKTKKTAPTVSNTISESIWLWYPNLSIFIEYVYLGNYLNHMSVIK